jgi:ABC-type Mn2+/Zn2+ transport system ATPase subunit
MHSSILMDEPDKGLDVVLLKALYGMLKTDKKDIQIIAVVHNPFLIHLLSGFSNVIETSPNYMKLVENFIK